MLPPQVVAFHQALRRLVAVREVQSDMKGLSAYTPDTFSLPGEFGDLPHALLRRTGGGLPDEVWVCTEIELSRDEAGWLTLEFLAWWVRDLSRSREQIQLRPMALPPEVHGVQLGRTLKFIIDQFVFLPGENNNAVLEMLQERADWLSRNIDDYADALGKCVRTRSEP